MPTTPQTVHVCPPDHKHAATSTCYTLHRCRCTECRTAATEYKFWRRNIAAAGRDDLVEVTVDARGVRRRLEALAAIGWTNRRLAERLGVDPAQVGRWLMAGRVTFTTHTRVEALYDALSDHPAPQGTTGDRISAQRAINRAQREGWSRPIDWDDIDLDEDPATVTLMLTPPVEVVDDVAVLRAVEGSRVSLTIQERREAVRQLHARGLNDKPIAAMLGVTSKTIERDRAFLGLPGNLPEHMRSAA